MTKRMLIVIGIVVFLAGGAVLALVPGPAGTAVGTTGGIAGIVLLGWAWLKGREEEK